MKVELSPEDELLVTLEGTDGEFRILFDVGGDNRMRILANLPGSEEYAIFKQLGKVINELFDGVASSPP